AGVEAEAAIVTKDKEFVRLKRNHNFSRGFRFRIEIRLAELFSIDVDLIARNLNGFARKADNALDKKLLLIARIVKDDYFSPHRFFEPIADFVHDKILALMEGWHHGSSFHVERRDKKITNRDNDRQRDDDDLQQFHEEVFDGASGFNFLRSKLR